MAQDRSIMNIFQEERDLILDTHHLQKPKMPPVETANMLWPMVEKHYTKLKEFSSQERARKQ